MLTCIYFFVWNIFKNMLSYKYIVERDMKKTFFNIFLSLFCVLALAFDVRADFLDAWKNEDEEISMKREKKTVDEDEEIFRLTVKETRKIQQSKKRSIPRMRSDFSMKNNPYIDYDILEYEKIVPQEEMVNSVEKWNKGRANVFCENYRGNNVRIEFLRNNRDVKEIRLKFVQSMNLNSDPDASIATILDTVADRVMNRICGKQVKQTILLYEKPSVELIRETLADGYKIMTKGNSLKEYGFRCLY